MYSVKEATKDVKWLFEKLLRQRGDAKWIEGALRKSAVLLVKMPNDLDETYEYYEEIVKYYLEHLDAQLEEKLTVQRRRHDYNHNFQPEDWLAAVEYFDYRCAYCGKDDKLTVDHFIPFSKGGELVRGNIVPACGICNSSKNNLEFKEWYTDQAFYDSEQEEKIIDFIN